MCYSISCINIVLNPLYLLQLQRGVRYCPNNFFERYRCVFTLKSIQTARRDFSLLRQRRVDFAEPIIKTNVE